MIKLALVQLQRTQDREENLRRVFNLVKGQEADVILLPENWLGPEVVPFDLGTVVYRKLKWSDVPKILERTGVVSASIMIIVAMATKAVFY